MNIARCLRRAANLLNPKAPTGYIPCIQQWAREQIEEHPTARRTLPPVYFHRLKEATLQRVSRALASTQG
jgi:hypothetical protein